MTQILNGKKLSDDIKQELKTRIEVIKQSGKRVPHLAAILVGENPASMSYVKSKVKDCEEVGFESSLIKLDVSIKEKELLAYVHQLNNDKAVDGFIVQLPLPKHIEEQKIIQAILPEKDVDGFHPINLGKMMLGLPTFVSATPLGILEILHRYKIETTGKHVIVLGRSAIVGTPVSILLSRNSNKGNATVTLCHSKTKNLKAITLQADIIIAAIGFPHFLKADMVKQGAVVIDVGINSIKDENGKNKLTGDVDYEELLPHCSAITPVPGGVGPMTRIALLMNTLKAWEAKNA
jgi:methylenetetrahydrofolate dehydrogenase (NADP+)/methenyltetrahydrofolate cyclohydrolase